MKIAICFLLVIFSSCFAAETSDLGSCRGKILKVEADVAAAVVTMMIQKYVTLKNKGLENSLANKCLVNSALGIAKMIAGFRGCSSESILEQMLKCLIAPESQKEILREILRTGDSSKAINFNVDAKPLLDAVCCTVKKLVTADGHNASAVFKGVFSGLKPMFGSIGSQILVIVDSLIGSVLGTILGIF